MRPATRVVLTGACLCACVSASKAEISETIVLASYTDAPEIADLRLEPGVRIFGVVVGDEPRAYSLADLQGAGGIVHDVIGGRPIDIGASAVEARIDGTTDDVREHRVTSWSDWIGAHPDTSLWRIPAIAEPEARRPAADIRVTESRDYRTGFGCTLMTNVTGRKPPGLFVISGKIENVAPDSVHHVVLRYELVTRDGRVVYREEGFNRAAEVLAAPRPSGAGAVVPIDPGATDTFRMILLSDELPAFEHTRVTVARVY